MMTTIFGQPQRRIAGLCALSVLLGAQAAVSGAAPSRGILLAANEKAGTLSLIDPLRGVRLGVIDEGGFAGHEVATSPDGRYAYVPIYGDGNAGTPGTDGRDVVKIDIAARRVVGRYTFDHGTRPHAAVFNAHDGLLYVTTELDHSVSIIDPDSMTLVGTIPTGQTLTHMLVISHDGRFAFSANIEPGSISILDLEARKLAGVVPVSAKIQRIALSSDGRYIYTADQTTPRVAVIDTASRAVAKWIPLPAVGMGLTTTNDGRLLVAIEPTSQLAIIDLAANAVIRTLDLPQYPHEVVLSPDGAMAFVSCSVKDMVVGIRMKDFRTMWSVTSGPFVDGLAWSWHGRRR